MQAPGFVFVSSFKFKVCFTRSAIASRKVARCAATENWDWDCILLEACAFWLFVIWNL